MYSACDNVLPNGIGLSLSSPSSLAPSSGLGPFLWPHRGFLCSVSKVPTSPFGGIIGETRCGRRRGPWLRPP